MTGLATNEAKLIKKLSPREGKVLRYVCSYTPNSVNYDGKQPNVVPGMCVVSTEWSDLPHTMLQARAALKKLEALKLVKKDGEGYTPTSEGHAVIKTANKQGIWRSKTD